MPDRKPCPWCRRADRLEPLNLEFRRRKPTSVAILCKGCGSTGPVAGNIRDAWLAWDGIPEPEPCPECEARKIEGGVDWLPELERA
jgi:hypothetical protein